MRIGRRKGCGINAIERGIVQRFQSAYGIFLFVREDKNVTGTAPITAWGDQSGGGHNGTQASIGPTFTAGAGANGKGRIAFAGTNRLDFGNLSALTAGEMSVVFRNTNAGADAGLLDKFGTAGAADNIPFSSGIFDGWGSTTRKSTGVLPNPSPVNQYVSYGRSSFASDWVAYLNGIQIFSTATNVVGFNTACNLGNGMTGNIQQYVIFQRKLSSTARLRRFAADKARYAL